MGLVLQRPLLCLEPLTGVGSLTFALRENYVSFPPKLQKVETCLGTGELP